MPAKRTRISRICVQCGAPFLARPSTIAKGDGFLCRRICANVYRTRPLADRTWEKVTQGDGALACWLWQGATYPNGYGHIGSSGHRSETLLVHRVAWWLATEHWPTDQETVCHDCPGGDNRACVRNDTIGIYVLNGVTYPKRGHLWLGNVPANNADTVNKGRSARGERHHSKTHPETILKGERHGRAKLTAEQVISIRTRYASGGILMRELAAEYGISIQHVSSIINRKTWKHVRAHGPIASL